MGKALMVLGYWKYFFSLIVFDADNQWRLDFLFHSTCVQVLRINSYKTAPVILEALSLFDVNAVIMLAIFNYYFGCGI